MVTRRPFDKPSVGHHADGQDTSPPDRSPSALLGPSLTVAAVARRLGVAPATLRTWDRRYGLGPSEHLAGAHRRYSSTDVARLLVMRRLTLEGVAPSEAARAALGSDGERNLDLPSATEVMDAYSDAVAMAPDPSALVAAAGHFDNAAVRWMLSRVHQRDVLAWWTELVEPALRALAERVALDRPGEAAGPALTAAAFAELRSRAAVAVARHQAPRPTVLALAAAEQADLRVHVLATALQSRGVRVRVAAADDPGAVAGAIERLQPSAVLLDVPVGHSVRVDHVVRAVMAQEASLPVFVHRQGGAPLDLPVAANVHRVRTLTGAVHEVLAVV